MERPTEPGYYWWRVGASYRWEPVAVTMNREGDLWCAFVGKCAVYFLSNLGGEWLGEAHPPKRVVHYYADNVVGCNDDEQNKPMVYREDVKKYLLEDE